MMQNDLDKVLVCFEMYSEKYKDYFEYRLYDDHTAPKDRKTAFKSRQIPIHIWTSPWEIPLIQRAITR